MINKIEIKMKSRSLKLKQQLTNKLLRNYLFRFKLKKLSGEGIGSSKPIKDLNKFLTVVA